MSTHIFFALETNFGHFCGIFFAPVARIIVIRCISFTRMLGWHLRKYWYRSIFCPTSYDTVCVECVPNIFISVACCANCWRPTIAQMERTCRCCHFKVSWTARRRWRHHNVPGAFRHSTLQDWRFVVLASECVQTTTTPPLVPLQARKDSQLL